MYNDTGTFLLMAMGGIFLAIGCAMFFARVLIGAELPYNPAFVAAIVFFTAAIAKSAISVGDHP